MRDYILSLVKGSSWILLGGVMGKFSVAVAYLLLARYLSPEKYGFFSIVQSNIVLFGTFAGLGLGTTAIKLISGTEKNSEKYAIVVAIIKIFLVSVTIVSIVIIIFSESLSIIFYSKVGYEEYFFLSIPLLITSTFFSLISSVYISLGLFSINGVCLIIQGFFLLLSYFILEPDNVADAINFLTFSFILPFIIFIFRMVIWKRELCCKIEQYNLNKILSVCIPITLSTLLVVPTNWIVTILLARYSPGGAIDVGLFNAASQWKNIILFVPMTLSPIMLSLLSKNVDNVLDHQKLLTNILVSGTTALFAFLVIYIFSDYMEIAYGNEYAGIKNLILVYSIVTVIIVINNSIGQYLISKGKLKLGFILNAIWASIYITFSFLLIEYGAVGVLYALGLSYVAHSILQLFFVIMEIRKVIS